MSEVQVARHFVELMRIHKLVMVIDTQPKSGRFAVLANGGDEVIYIMSHADAVALSELCYSSCYSVSHYPHQYMVFFPLPLWAE